MMLLLLFEAFRETPLYVETEKRRVIVSYLRNACACNSGERRGEEERNRTIVDFQREGGKEKCNKERILRACGRTKERNVEKIF